MRNVIRCAGLTKQKIRTTILHRLRIQKEADRARKSWRIKQKLFKTPVFKKAKVVMSYVSFDGEVDTEDMIQDALNLGKTIVVPVCGRSRTLHACILHRDTKLQRGLYGTSEPVIKKPVAFHRIDLVMVPGVAFDAKGRRLGRGRGCYDRFLKKLPSSAYTIGLAFDFQILPRIPATNADVAVSKVIVA
ncbi:MAG: 5-formyltetrahydrofolate cyclo-ligase [Candidatus Omnitrophica bacterium]|nr:5-formyltetrahydrofolate cyclo-ligase [Candidatus Omnitrophota bacterium]